QEPAVTRARMDPEPLRRLLGEEPRRLIVGHAAEEEAGREADRARAGRDEVREAPETGEVEVPALTRDEPGEGRLARHQRLAAALDRLGHPRGARVEPAARGVAREQDAALLEELAHGRDPEGERRRAGVVREQRLRLRRRDAPAARENLGRRVLWIHLAPRERVE